MAFINWTSVYSTGIGQIDSQHKSIAELINNLHDAMKAGKAKEQMSDYIKELTETTV